jgi:hypothetical protein
MDCRDFEEIVVELAREGTEDASASEHAAACPRCAARLENERRLTVALLDCAAGSTGAEAPQRVEDALVAAFRRTVTSRPSRWPVWASAVAAGVAVFAIAVGLQPRDPVPPAAPQDEVVTEYFPLQYGTDLTALEGAPVIRMEFPRTVVVSFGLPINPQRAAEPVQADVVLGSDGIARAVRFVQ